jgi:hypothetical protein
VSVVILTHCTYVAFAFFRNVLKRNINPVPAIRENNSCNFRLIPLEIGNQDEYYYYYGSIGLSEHFIFGIQRSTTDRHENKMKMKRIAYTIGRYLFYIMVVVVVEPKT